MNEIEIDEINDLIVLYMLYKTYQMYKSYKRTTNRRWWVREINLTRDIDGYFMVTFQKIKERDPEQFFKHTRMTLPVYNILLSLLRNKLTKNSIRTAIDAECRLVLTLSYLSQGVSEQFLAWSYKMGRSTVHCIITETCEIIWEILSEFYVSQPNENDYKKISQNFEKIWDLPNCIGAIDGKHISIQCPPRSGSLYFNYKSDFSIVLLAACDAMYSFTAVDIGAYGSQSDGGILSNSNFGKKLLLSLEKRIFNYRISRARVVIENSFGILVARWRVLKNTLCCTPKKAEKIVLATIALHNFIILNKQSNQVYCPKQFVDWEDELGNMHQGEWRTIIGENSAVENISYSRNIKMGSNNSTKKEYMLRDILKDYFVKEGAIDKQKKVQCGFTA